MKLTQQDIQQFLDRLKPLTLDQYDACKVAVTERVRAIIGEKPTREKLSRDEGGLMSPLDMMAAIVFIAALIVSSIHIINHTGQMAGDSWEDAHLQVSPEEAVAGAPTSIESMSTPDGEEGITFSKQVYTVLHQVGFVFLAEASMLLFLVTWRMTMGEDGKRWYNPGPLVNLILALVAMAFVITANVSSGLGILEALMPPVFTIGIGFHLEKLIVEFIRRRSTLTARLADALDLWEIAVNDPTKHAEYRPLLVREIWEKLSRLKDNREYVDIGPAFKWAAVNRELERDTWAHDQVQVAVISGESSEVAQEEDGLRRLLMLVKKAPEKPVKGSTVITFSDFEADLVALTWTDKKSGKSYGPYKSRYNMVAGIAQVVKIREREEKNRDNVNTIMSRMGTGVQE